MQIRGDIIPIGFLRRLIGCRCHRCGQRLYRYVRLRARYDELEITCPDEAGCAARVETLARRFKSEDVEHTRDELRIRKEREG